MDGGFFRWGFGQKAASRLVAHCNSEPVSLLASASGTHSGFLPDG